MNSVKQSNNTQKGFRNSQATVEKSLTHTLLCNPSFHNHTSGSVVFIMLLSDSQRTPK